jgi:putative effector of murein hydrolase/putative effector of murein hydrolase LrgA (UPF0299 family)
MGVGACVGVFVHEHAHVKGVCVHERVLEHEHVHVHEASRALALVRDAYGLTRAHAGALAQTYTYDAHPLTRARSHRYLPPTGAMRQAKPRAAGAACLALLLLASPGGQALPRACPAALPACRGGGCSGPAAPTAAPAEERWPARLRAALPQAQIAGGSALIFALERGIWACGRRLGRRVPSAPTGMVLVFVALVAAHAAAPAHTERVAEWFAPSVAALLQLVPLFFAPPLVQLPLALAPLSRAVVLRMVAVVLSGSIVGCLATGAAVQVLWGVGCGGESRSFGKEGAAGAAGAAGVGSRGERTGGHEVPPAPVQSAGGATAPLTVAMAGAGLLMCIAFATGHDSVVIALLSLVSLRVGNSAPASVRKFVPAVVTSAVLTSVGVQRLGVARGTSPMHALRVYRTASGGVMGGSGVGDVTFAMAAPVIVGLGFRLFEQRALLWLHLGPLLGGSLANCVLSVSYTVLACRLVQVPADVGKSLVARFITLPMAVPLTEALGGSVALASLAASIQGIVAAAFCQQLLDLIGVRGRLARGLAIGGSAHALGTATAAGSDEPSIAPAAALCFMISGALMNLMACSPAAVNALVLLL